MLDRSNAQKFQTFKQRNRLVSRLRKHAFVKFQPAQLPVHKILQFSNFCIHMPPLYLSLASQHKMNSNTSSKKLLCLSSPSSNENPVRIYDKLQFPVVSAPRPEGLHPSDSGSDYGICQTQDRRKLGDQKITPPVTPLSTSILS